jgi:glycosyltransferase involved in cell wall biosynthesis
LHFHVIGHVDRPMPVAPVVPLTIGGSYDDEHLARVIALERPDAWLFLARVPETWSYTLSAALATGLPIVATALGAIAERLRDVRHAQLVAPDATAGAINDALLAQLQPARMAPRARVASPP